MSFKCDLDEYIEFTLVEGVQPEVDILLEDVPVPSCAGPSMTPSTGPVATGPGISGATAQATFQDNDNPAMFRGASGRNIPAAMFQSHPIAAPPAMFGGAARMSRAAHEAEEVLGVVLADLEEFSSLEEFGPRRGDQLRIDKLERSDIRRRQADHDAKHKDDKGARRVLSTLSRPRQKFDPRMS